MVQYHLPTESSRFVTTFINTLTRADHNHSSQSSLRGFVSVCLCAPLKTLKVRCRCRYFTDLKIIFCPFSSDKTNAAERLQYPIICAIVFNICYMWWYIYIYHLKKNFTFFPKTLFSLFWKIVQLWQSCNCCVELCVSWLFLPFMCPLLTCSPYSICCLLSSCHFTAIILTGGLVMWIYSYPTIPPSAPNTTALKCQAWWASHTHLTLWHSTC